MYSKSGVIVLIIWLWLVNFTVTECHTQTHSLKEEFILAHGFWKIQPKISRLQDRTTMKECCGREKLFKSWNQESREIQEGQEQESTAPDTTLVT